MKQFLLGAVGSLLLAGAAVFIAVGLAEEPNPLPDAPPPPLTEDPLALPRADADLLANAKGPPPPEPPAAKKATREERRFNRYDRNRDEIITRVELMSSRTKAFRKLDKDGNNLLTFEEWAVTTSDRFAGADANGNGELTRAEFATTRPKRKPQPKCRC